MILLAQKEKKSEREIIFTQLKCLEIPYPDILKVMREKGQVLPPNALNGSNWTLTDSTSASRLQKMAAAGVTLGEYVKGKIYYGIKTGFNEAFVIDGAKRAELMALDAKSAEIIKPLAVGKDIRKWCIDSKNRWLIVTPIGINTNCYPAVFAHLKQWQAELEKRYDKGKHWWELRACDYYSAFDKPKIMYPDIAKTLRFAFNKISLYLGNTTYFMATEDLYLLGVLNSSSVENY